MIAHLNGAPATAARTLLLALFVLLLAACGAAEGEGEAVSAPVEEPAIAEDDDVDADIVAGAEELDVGEEVADEEPLVEEEADVVEEETPASDAAAADEDARFTPSGKRILTEDTRSRGLKRLTDSWNTNWHLHTIDYDELLAGGPPRDGIPSIDDPQFIPIVEALEWLAPNEPVIALEIDGDARAYPLQIMTWHEIVNDTVGDVPVVVTFCPLCNSALTFDRRIEGEVYEFGTSGLLRHSDLVMYDRTTESLWQQFTGEAIVGTLVGEQLDFIASSIVSFEDFREAFPDGVVLSRDTGFSRSYGENPYVGYDRADQNPFLFRGPLDERLPAMARVVTVSTEEGDAAYPYSVLEEALVVHDQIGDQALVVFWSAGTSSALDARVIAEGADVGATGVFAPFVDGEQLTFSVEDGTVVDDQTGSVWNILGQATEGPLAGEQLAAIPHGDHFWFSWAAFRPETKIFQPDA